MYGEGLYSQPDFYTSSFPDNKSGLSAASQMGGLPTPSDQHLVNSSMRSVQPAVMLVPPRNNNLSSSVIDARPGFSSNLISGVGNRRPAPMLNNHFDLQSHLLSERPSSAVDTRSDFSHHVFMENRPSSVIGSRLDYERHTYVDSRMDIRASSAFDNSRVEFGRAVFADNSQENRPSAEVDCRMNYVRPVFLESHPENKSLIMDPNRSDFINRITEPQPAGSISGRLEYHSGGIMDHLPESRQISTLENHLGFGRHGAQVDNRPSSVVDSRLDYSRPSYNSHLFEGQQFSVNESRIDSSRASGLSSQLDNVINRPSSALDGQGNYNRSGYKESHPMLPVSDYDSVVPFVESSATNHPASSSDLGHLGDRPSSIVDLHHLGNHPASIADFPRPGTRPASIADLSHPGNRPASVSDLSHLSMYLLNRNTPFMSTYLENKLDSTVLHQQALLDSRAEILRQQVFLETRLDMSQLAEMTSPVAQPYTYADSRRQQNNLFSSTDDLSVLSKAIYHENREHSLVASGGGIRLQSLIPSPSFPSAINPSVMTADLSSITSHGDFSNIQTMKEVYLENQSNSQISEHASLQGGLVNVNDHDDSKMSQQVTDCSSRLSDEEVSVEDTSVITRALPDFSSKETTPQMSLDIESLTEHRHEDILTLSTQLSEQDTLTNNQHDQSQDSSSMSPFKDVQINEAIGETLNNFTGSHSLDEAGVGSGEDDRGDTLPTTAEGEEFSNIVAEDSILQIIIDKSENIPVSPEASKVINDDPVRKMTEQPSLPYSRSTAVDENVQTVAKKIDTNHDQLNASSTVTEAKAVTQCSLCGEGFGNYKALSEHRYSCSSFSNRSACLFTRTNWNFLVRHAVKAFHAELIFRCTRLHTQKLGLTSVKSVDVDLKSAPTSANM